MRRFRNFIFYLLLATIILVVTAIVLARVYEPEIKNHFISHLNNYLNTEVKVRDYKVSLIRSFPYASLEFRDVVIGESIPGTDSEFARVESIFLLFNIMDMFRGRYEIEKVRIANGDIWIRVDPLGRENYRLFKDSPDSTSTDFTLDITTIDLLNVNIHYADFPAKQNFAIDLHKAVISGNFSSDKYLLKLEGDVHVKQYTIDNIAYLKDKKVWLQTGFDVDNTNGTYSVNKGRLKLGGANFLVDGYFQDKENSLYADLKITAHQSNIHTLLALVPDAYRPYFKDYEHSGHVYFNAAIKGDISATLNPSINVNFGIENGKVKNKSNGMAMEDVNFKGRFTNGNHRKASSSEISIEDFSGRLNGKDVTGNLLLRNFDNPYIKTGVKTGIELLDVDRFFKIPGFDEIAGLVKIDASFEGNINDLKQTSTISRTKSTGHFEFHNLRLKPANTPHAYSGLNGKMIFNGNDLAIQNFTGQMQETDFSLDGSFRNFASYLFLPGHVLHVEANLKSRFINLNELLYTPATSANDTGGLLSLPANISFNFRLAVDKLVFEKFTAGKLSGQVKYANKKADLSGVKLETMNGFVNLQGSIEEKNNQFLVKGTADGRNINIQQMFWQLGNFGQEFIMDKHMRGTLSSTVIFSGVWNNDLSPDFHRMEAVADMNIRNGELVEFEPVTEMAGFIKLRRLRHLKFDELNNRILIKDNLITIPRMDLTNNLMAMSVSGTHTFDNHYTYRVKLNLSDLLFGAEDQFDSRFGEIVPAGGGINLNMVLTGNDQTMEFRHDRQAARENIAQGLKEEKKELKELFAREFGRKNEREVTLDDEDEITIEINRPQGGREARENPSRTEKERRNAYQRFWQKIKEEL